MSKKMFAWYSCEDRSQGYGDGFHKDISSFEVAFKEAFGVLIAKRYSNTDAIPAKEVEIFGSTPCGMKAIWQEKVLTKKDIKKHVLELGLCQFRIRYKDKDREDRHIQGWSRISTMEYLNKEQDDLKKRYQKEVQEEANRTGKKAVLYCLAGWRFEAEPKKTKPPKN